MPRQARKLLKSNYYHIIVQGINKEYIFKEDNLKEAYKYLLKKNISGMQITILAYCIMENHAHILIHCKDINEIIKLMRRTNTSYAKLYNKSKERVGYVFRDRYYTQMILNRRHLLNCISYIHNNPIKAHIVKQQSEYKYSSYIEYLENKDLITAKSIKLAFGSNENFIDMFQEIHKNKNIEDIDDILEERKKGEQIIKEYLEKNKLKFEETVNDEKKFGKLLLELRHSGRLSLREMSKIFNMGKDKLNRIIKNSL